MCVHVCVSWAVNIHVYNGKIFGATLAGLELNRSILLKDQTFRP